MAAGNTEFLNATAFAADHVIDHQFLDVWTTAHPILKILKENKKNFNKGVQRRENKAIIPIIYTGPSTAANGKSDANSLTAITPYALAGFTASEWEYTRYEGAWYLRPHERELLKNGSRGNLVQGAVTQMMGSFKTALSDDIAGNSAADRENLQGLRQALSTSNTVGGIDQSDGSNGFWHAKVRTTGGTFTTQDVDSDYDSIATEGRGAADLLLLSHNSTVNLFGKMRDNVAPIQRINAPQSVAKFGFPSFEYMDMMCVLDNRLGAALSTTGGYMMLKTDTWYWSGADRPTLLEDKCRLEGTGAYEYYYEWWCMLGCSDLACNAYSNAYTG